METTIYDHYIAIDWSAKVMAIARMTKKSNRIKSIEAPSDVEDLKIYLKNLKGKKVLAIEETTISQWLYTELRDCVERLIICDPYRNKLLNEGAKTDKIDATKLVQLLKAGLLKEVYHSCEKFLYLRRLVSGYEDLVATGVRLKNQRYSLLRACGKTGYEAFGIKLEEQVDRYVLECIERQIVSYGLEKKRYAVEFKVLAKKHKEIRDQMSLPGIKEISAVKIVSRVVTPYRFATKGHYLSYAGLIKLGKHSGGRSYGKKDSRYCRQLKSVYKTSIQAAIGGNNSVNDYYRYLKYQKGYDERRAKHKSCRQLATLSWGVFKSGKSYKPNRRAHIERDQEVLSGL